MVVEHHTTGAGVSDSGAEWGAHPMTPSGEHGWELTRNGQRVAVCIAPGRETARVIMAALDGVVHHV